MFKKSKTKPISFYKRKLWKIFSEYIRRKDADENGMATCISCGKAAHYTELHAGHYIPKSLGNSIYFCELNVHVQCPGCNTFRHGNLTEYALALKRKYGDDVLERLNEQKNSVVQFRKPDYEEMIAVYNEKLKALA